MNKKPKIISPAFSLTKDDLQKILIGALIALSGATITFLTQLPEMIDWGMWTPMIAALCSIGINLVRKYIIKKEK